VTRAAAARRLGPRTRLAIDVVGALGLVGTLVRYLSLSALAPVAVALGYGESPWPFLGAGAIAGAIGLALERIAARRPRRVGWREGSLVISLTWLLAAAYGGLPYVLAGVPGLDRPIDALFEGMSGFTTTGASLLLDFEALNHSMAMWRQLTQWLGGLGIIVLAFAILPRLHVGGRQLLESELPGPEINQLGDRVRQTVRRFWVLYVALTVLEAIALAVVGWTGLDDRMSPFDAIAHALTTIPTGGFSPESRSLEGFAAATHWVVIVFMFLAGMNFALLWGALLRGRIRALLRDDELQLYAVVLAAAAGLLVVELATEDLSGSDNPLRHGVFQAVALMTGTGFATVDFAGWPTLALMTIVALMFFGGAAGSTTGSVKLLRHVIVARSLKRELRLAVHPESVRAVRFNRSPVENDVVRAAIVFVLLYLGLFVAGTGIIALDASFDGPTLTALDAFSTAASTLGNVGPASGPAGPMASYESFSDVSTIVMSALMWLGRLEILPVLVLFTRTYWRR